MDGIKYVVPMSCRHEKKVIPGDLTLFYEEPDTVEEYECKGCKYNYPTKHNGRYVKIMNWHEEKTVKFIELHANNLQQLRLVPEQALRL